MTDAEIASAKADIESTAECVPSARQMMAAALKDAAFDWAEAERMAASPDFGILDDFRRLKREISDGLAK